MLWRRGSRLVQKAGGRGFQSSLTEDTSETESRRYRLRRRGSLFSREEKSDFGLVRRGRISRVWLTILMGFEDDGARKAGRISVK